MFEKLPCQRDSNRLPNHGESIKNTKNTTISEKIKIVSRRIYLDQEKFFEKTVD
jgi:hypothetical protein